MLRQVLIALAVTEVVLVATLVWLVLGGGAASSQGTATFSGIVAMATFAIPMTGLLLWSRDRSHALFLTAVGVAFLGKMIFVGAILLYIVLRTEIPQLEFILGLLGGWLASFFAQTWLLRGGLARAGALDSGR